MLKAGSQGRSMHNRFVSLPAPGVFVRRPSGDPFRHHHDAAFKSARAADPQAPMPLDIYIVDTGHRSITITDRKRHSWSQALDNGEAIPAPISSSRARASLTPANLIPA